MTPKEKAFALFTKFYFVNSESVELITGEYELLFSLHESDAKKCALICVDEIMEELECNADDFGLDIPNSVYSYWINIKQEIEKL